METFYNPDPASCLDKSGEDVEEKNKNLDNPPEESGLFCMENVDSGFFSAVESGYEEPKTFREAWDHPDKEERKKWREAIRKEIWDMINRNVWRHMKKRDVPPERRLVGSKWVFKIKNC